MSFLRQVSGLRVRSSDIQREEPPDQEETQNSLEGLEV